MDICSKWLPKKHLFKRFESKPFFQHDLSLEMCEFDFSLISDISRDV